MTKPTIHITLKHDEFEKMTGRRNIAFPFGSVVHLTSMFGLHWCNSHVYHQCTALSGMEYEQRHATHISQTQLYFKY